MLSANGNVRLEDLSAMVARKVMARKSSVLPFVDYSDILTELLVMYASPDARLISAGLLPADVAQAADRARVEAIETFGASPFSYDLRQVIENVDSRHDLIYLGNPSRLTGANCSLADMEHLADAVDNGLLIIDEYFYDYYGVSGYPLLEKRKNVVVMRSFSSAFSIRSAESGYLMANPSTIDTINRGYAGRSFSATVRKTIMLSLVNHEAMSTRLQEVHEESLRLATTLSRIGVQCRICATDFILLRVANPSAVAEALGRSRVQVEMLQPWSNMEKYLRYQIQSVLSNDRLIKTFEKMPSSHYLLSKSEMRKTTLHRPGEKVIDKPANRLKKTETVYADLETAAEAEPVEVGKE